MKHFPRYWSFEWGIHRHPQKRPVTWSFHIFFELCLNKRFRKQLWGWWFETLSRPFWRHCNDRTPLPLFSAALKHLGKHIYIIDKTGNRLIFWSLCSLHRKLTWSVIQNKWSAYIIPLTCFKLCKVRSTHAPHSHISLLRYLQKYSYYNGLATFSTSACHKDVYVHFLWNNECILTYHGDNF